MGKGKLYCSLWKKSMHCCLFSLLSAEPLVLAEINTFKYFSILTQQLEETQKITKKWQKNVLFLFVGRTEGQAENLRLVYNGIRINAGEEGFKDILFNNLQCRLEIEKKENNHTGLILLMSAFISLLYFCLIQHAFPSILIRKRACLSHICRLSPACHRGMNKKCTQIPVCVCKLALMCVCVPCLS